jgi:gliding motility-associated-like protein
MKLAACCLLLLGCVLSWSQVPNNGQIIGPDNVCVRECYVYTFTGSDGTPVAPDAWDVRDGLGNIISFELLDDSTSIRVCFGSTTEFTIRAVVPGGFITRTVTPGTFSDLPVTVEIDECKSYRPLDCIEVCQDMRFRVRVDGLVLEQLQWQDFGLRGMKIIEQNNQFIYLEANVPPGRYELVYFGNTQSQCFFEGNLCIDVLPPPEAGFVANYPVSEDTITLCLDQELRLQNTSDAREHQWLLPDGSVSTSQVLSQTFSTPGTYTIAQQVSNFECLCSDEKPVYVVVLNASGPAIFCSGTVCQGDTTTYETESDCVPYQWTVSANGIIVAGGGPEDDFIRVHWPQGNTGTVSLINGCHPVCPVPGIAEIPILGNDNRITGPARVCVDGEYIFQTDNLGGTDFRWEILPQGTIVEGQGSPRIRARFSFGPTQRQIVLHYENCHLECSGSDTLVVNLAERFAIEGGNRLCQGESITWTARRTQWPNSTVISQWDVLDTQGNIVYQNPGQSATFDWPGQLGAGRFIVVARAVSGDFCQEDARLLIQVFQTPVMTASIEGPDSICPQSLLTYSLSMQDPSLTYVWEVTQSGQTTTRTEYPLQIVLDGSPSMRIAVKAVDPLSGCSSVFVEKLPVVLDTLRLNQQGADCLFGESVFTVLGEQLGEVQWTVSNPAIANRLDFPDGQSARFKWLQPGTVDITATYCGLSTTFNQAVSDYFQPVVVHPAFVCQGQSAVAQAQGTWQSYRWYRGDELLCTTADCVLSPGQYRLEVLDSAGCPGRTFFEIENRTLPNIQIFAPNGTGFCLGDSTDLVSTWINDPRFIYTWIRDGADLPDTDNTLIIRDFATYQRRITDTSTGCSYTTPPISFCEFCDPNLVCYGCPCSPLEVCSLTDPQVAATIDLTARCNEFNFEILTPGIVPGTVRWIIQSPSGLVFTQTDVSFTRRFNEVGYYLVTLFAEYIDGMGIRRKPCPTIFNIEVSAVARFDYSRACLNEPTEFESQSTLLGNTQILGYQWAFGDPAMGSSTLANPQYLYPAGGNYAVTLRIDTDRGCFADTTQWINIIQPVPVQWTFDPDICIDEAFEVDLDTMQLLDIAWYFDLDNSPNDVMAIRTPGRHGYTSPGTYRFGVLVLDALGCRSFRSDQVIVHALPDPGTITADKTFPVCAGDTVILESTVPGVSYFWTTGETSQQIRVAESGRYQVSITDSQGCSAVAGPVQASFFPLPDSTVSLQGGSTGVFSPDTLLVCAGESVSLQALALPELASYLWSTGDTSQTIRYDDIQYPRLNPGDYTLTLTITDRITGCVSVNTRIFIRVHALPDVPQISGDQPAPWCSPNPVNLQVDNPAAGVQYTWNTGEMQASITIQSPGRYWVEATNEFGCRIESARVEMFGPPAMNFLPEGCFIACEADTICLPPTRGFRITEWLLDGQALIPQPSDVRSPVLTTSGSYSVHLITDEGCTYTSSAFDYDIFPGYGTLGGILFEDLNNDGQYNAGEPLLNGIRVILEGPGIQDTIVSGTPGSYYFRKLPLGNYVIRIDPESLPDGFTADPDSINVVIQACDDEFLDLGFPIYACQSDTTHFNYQLCVGENIQIGGESYIIERDTLIRQEVADGACLDVFLYQLQVFPQSPPSVQTLTPCLGDYVDLLGLRIERDTTLTDTLPDINGCDSLSVFEVAFRPLGQEQVSLRVCPGDEIMFREIPIRRDTLFTYRAEGLGLACDTLFDVAASVHTLVVPTFTLTPSCPGKDDGLIQIAGNSVGRISLDGLDLGETSLIRPVSPGDHQLIWTDSNQCRQVFDIFMDESEPLVASIPDTIIQCGEETVLRIEVQSGMDSTFRVLWQNGSQDMVLPVSRPGIYLAEVRNACETQMLRGVVANLDEGRKKLYFVPSAFTPNEDGINETFKTFWPDDVVFESFLLEVFDRWGQLQFRTTDPEAAWDGFRQEDQEKIAVYVWKLDAVVNYCQEQQVIKDSGDVTMIR